MNKLHGRNSSIYRLLLVLICFAVPLLSTCSANKPQTQKIFRAVRNGDINAVKKMIAEHVDLNVEESNGTTPIFYTVSVAYPEPCQMNEGEDYRKRRKADHEKKIVMFDLVMSTKPNVNKKRSSDGTTPLHWATSAMQIMNQPYDMKVIKGLIDAGADVNAVDDRGWTPLMEITVSSRLEIFKLLIKNGADPKLKNKKGKTVLDLANEVNAKEEMKILNAAPSKGAKP